MWAIVQCVRVEHDFRLVLLAAIVCVAAAVVSLRFYRRAWSGSGSNRQLQIAGAGVVAGGGVWTTHFVSMLAYRTATPMSYELATTSASLLVAVLGMTVGFSIASRVRPRSAPTLGGVIVGLSIAAMHFVGISAIRSPFAITWNLTYLAASVLAAAMGGAVALTLDQTIVGRASRILPPLALIIGIVALHFTAMTAMQIIPDPFAAPVIDVVNRVELAWMAVSVAAIVIGAAAILSLIDTYHRRAGFRQVEGIFQGLPSGLAMFDQEGRLLVWNEAYSRLIAEFSMTPCVGITREDMGRQLVLSGVLAQEQASSDRLNAVLVERRCGAKQDWPTKSGRWIRMEMSHIPSGTISIVSDVTEERATADAMRQARDRAEASNRAKSAFLANMSHEIRTPLNGLLGMTQVIETGELSDAQRERLQVVKESGQTLLMLLDDILDLSRVQAGKLELDLTPVDVHLLTRKVAAAFGGVAAERGIEIIIETSEPSCGGWLVDEKRLRQILSNLVGNAVKFTDQGSVHISVQTVADGISLRVADTGIGIPKDFLPSLFDKFAQADASTSRRYGGSGLGLAICWELTSLMGGDITVSSVEGEGSTFTLSIPCHRAVLPTAEPYQALVSASSNRLRILAAEDNPTNQLVLRSLLEAMEYDVCVVENGLLAVEAAGREVFDVILMDIQMPAMNGVEAVAEIRRRELITGGTRTPVIALTANVMTHQLEEYRAAGMDECLAKPIELAKLHAAISLAVSRRAESQAA